MVAHAVSAVDIYVERREVPYLNDGERADYIGEKAALSDVAVVDMVQQRVIAPDNKYKYKVVYQLKIFDLFFFFYLNHALTFVLFQRIRIVNRE